MTDRPGPQDPPTPPAGLTWRDPVLWLVVGPPLAAVLGGIATVWIAASHRDPLVSDSVRKVGVTWQDAAAPPTRAAPPPAGAAVEAGPPPRADEASDDDGG